MLLAGRVPQGIGAAGPRNPRVRRRTTHGSEARNACADRPPGAPHDRRRRHATNRGHRRTPV